MRIAAAARATPEPHEAGLLAHLRDARLEHVAHGDRELPVGVAQLERLERALAAALELEHRDLVADRRDLAAHAPTDTLARRPRGAAFSAAANIVAKSSSGPLGGWLVIAGRESSAADVIDDRPYD